MLAYIDFVSTCDWCRKVVGTENLIEFYDKKTGDDWYFCKDCMKEVRKIRRQKKKGDENDRPENT